MKRLVVLICIICLILAPGAALAKKTNKGQGKGLTPNESAYEHASDNAKFKRSDDWQGGQGKYEDEDEINASDEKGEESKEHERHKEKHTKKKSKGEHDDADIDDAGKKKMKKSDDENGDAKADESNENRESDRDKEQYSKQKGKAERGETNRDTVGKKKSKKSE